MAKKLFIKLSLMVGMVLLCVFSIRDNSIHTSFLKLQNSVNKRRIRKEIFSLEEELTKTYTKIGQKISIGDINQEQVREEVNSLIDLSKQCLSKIDYKKGQIVVSDEKLKKRIVFENLLKDLFSPEVPKSLEALRAITITNTRESLPYLGVLLVDPSPSVHRETGAIINQIVMNSSQEIKKLIPNLGYLTKLNLSNKQDSWQDTEQIERPEKNETP